MSENPDKRLYVRYEMNSGAEVNLSVSKMFGFRNKQVKLGLILDISMGGIAIKYDGNTINSLRVAHLSIVIPGKGTLIESIPFETVTDCDFGTCPGEIFPRRCGLKFGSLTDEQRTRLKLIVKNYSSKKDMGKSDNL